MKLKKHCLLDEQREREPSPMGPLSLNEGGAGNAVGSCKYSPIKQKIVGPRNPRIVDETLKRLNVTAQPINCNYIKRSKTT